MYDRILRKFDSRIVQRHLARKVVTRDEYKAHMSKLDDCGHLADESEVDFVASPRKDETEEKD
jgi:hypothetical protein